MNAINNGLKALTCGIGALSITAVMSWSFIQSTSAAPGSAPTEMARLTLQQRHVWFGQSQPAVLVD